MPSCSSVGIVCLYRFPLHLSNRTESNQSSGSALQLPREHRPLLYYIPIPRSPWTGDSPSSWVSSSEAKLALALALVLALPLKDVQQLQVSKSRRDKHFSYTYLIFHAGWYAGGRSWTGRVVRSTPQSLGHDSGRFHSSTT
jgi:hypothetical protein